MPAQHDPSQEGELRYRGEAGVAAHSDQQEKNRITLVSVVAALALAVLKLVAGLLTGSLALLSDAAHSGLDCVASVITYVTVRIAGRPADQDHPYGHGRVENLSAILQAVLLIGTALAIIYESVRRIFFQPAEIHSSPWIFAVMFLSIGVDLWRSRLLAGAARRYHSRAMEADALNFRADMLASAMVIGGLTVIALGGPVHADAAAALLVALIIIVMSGRLALRGVSVLLDRAPVHLGERMTQAVVAVPGVVDAQPVRLRESGDRLFADITVQVPRTTSLSEAHGISESVEASLRDLAPRTQAVVHVEPAVGEAETAAEAIRAVAWGIGARTHHERVSRVGDHLEASLHIEVEPELTLAEAHALAHRLSAALRAENPLLQQVDTHIEVAVLEPSLRREVGEQHPKIVATAADAVKAAEVGALLHEARLYGSSEPGWDLTLHCGFPPEIPMGDIHRRTERIEQELRRAIPNLEIVVIHAEPRG